jgi:hypothetical protein
MLVIKGNIFFTGIVFTRKFQWKGEIPLVFASKQENSTINPNDIVSHITFSLQLVHEKDNIDVIETIQPAETLVYIFLGIGSCKSLQFPFSTNEVINDKQDTLVYLSFKVFNQQTKTNTKPILWNYEVDNNFHFQQITPLAITKEFL